MARRARVALAVAALAAPVAASTEAAANAGLFDDAARAAGSVAKTGWWNDFLAFLGLVKVPPGPVLNLAANMCRTEAGQCQSIGAVGSRCSCWFGGREASGTVAQDAPR